MCSTGIGFFPSIFHFYISFSTTLSVLLSAHYISSLLLLLFLFFAIKLIWNERRDYDYIMNRMREMVFNGMVVSHPIPSQASQYQVFISVITLTSGTAGMYMMGNKSTVKVILCFSLFFLPSRAHCSIPADRWCACSALQYMYVLLTNHFPFHSIPIQSRPLNWYMYSHCWQPVAAVRTNDEYIFKFKYYLQLEYWVRKWLLIKYVLKQTTSQQRTTHDRMQLNSPQIIVLINFREKILIFSI